MKLLTRIAVALFAVWLFAWIVLSWGAIQDDALIHLRYADFLYRVHFITYDGVNPSYGASSLLYVGLLAVLRGWMASPLLPRAVSSVFHVLLFAGFAAGCLRAGRSASTRVQAFALCLLMLLVVPSAVRWLDDGMETGIVLGVVALVAWQTHRLSLHAGPLGRGFLVAAVLGFLLVMVRNELILVAVFASTMLALAAAGVPGPGWRIRLLRGIPASSSFALGAATAALAIRVIMGSFLPDTALAKSHGIGLFLPILGATLQVFVGSLLFGLGFLALWLISAAEALHGRGARLLPTLAANALFPLVLLASALRGQQIQGIRYLIWAFFFSVVWNFLELWQFDKKTSSAPRATRLAFPFIVLGVLCLIALPVESHLIFRVLTTRARTMKLFMSQDLATPLRGELGMGSDIGYISYFTGDRICDVAGLVNGRSAATLQRTERISRCAAETPGFLFSTSSQAGLLGESVDHRGWVVCGQYDFGNVTTPDRHYLIVRPGLAQAVCRATGSPPRPYSYAETPTRY